MQDTARRLAVTACVLWGLAAGMVSAQDPGAAPLGAPIIDVVVEQEGQPVADPVVVRLAGVLTGRPLSVADVRETAQRLMSLNRFDDVRPVAEPVEGGVRLRFVLEPLRPVDRVEFGGSVGLPERELRRVVNERFGRAPAAARREDVAAALRNLYRDRGYPEARVTASIEEGAGRAAMVMTIDAGPRARIAAINLVQIDPEGVAAATFPDVRVGQPYDAGAIERQLDAYVERMRSRGYYEARATHTVSFGADSLSAVVTLTVERGPRVVVAFAGDPLPAAEQSRLVPIRAEGSADEDLLEDSARAIREYLFAQGYRAAQAEYSRTETPEQLTITFDVVRGPRHVVRGIRFDGNEELADDALEELLTLRSGDPFVQRPLDQAVTRIVAEYRRRGFTRVDVSSRVEILPGDGGNDVPVNVLIDVTEGPGTTIRSVSFAGAEAIGEPQLRSVMQLREDAPYSEVARRGDQDRIELEYRNRGYERAAVSVQPAFTDDLTSVDLQVIVSAGPQILVDHIIVVGNRRTGTDTIERELLLRPGEPLGYSDLLESRSRLVALGLFRRVQIETLAHSTEPRRDVLVTVEEAPVYSFSFGPGLEGGFRLRRQPDGTGVERLEIAPRGFFEIGRRNLWGKNRSVNLFTRVSLRSRDVGVGDPVDGPVVETSHGFNEYRVLATYREPRVFGTAADALVSGIFDQAVRTRFNFITREARAEIGWRISRQYSVLGRYTVKKTELFDEDFTEADRPLIDRVFPQVRLSKFAGSLLRDTRDDLLDPSRGTFVSLDGEVAGRAIGSEVGFVKSYLQAFSYRQLPLQRRTVLALGARIGVAHGFPRLVTGIGENGEPVQEILQDLPASERFFAGGDTTVRGFALDRLGSDETISPLTGFPTGGNAVLVLNAEMRVALFRNFNGIGFVDAGNVFLRPRSLDVFDLRPAAGAGVLSRAWGVPIRLDLGFNLRPRDLVPGQRERGYVLHLALGPAF